MKMISVFISWHGMTKLKTFRCLLPDPCRCWYLNITTSFRHNIDEIFGRSGMRGRREGASSYIDESLDEYW